MHRFLPGISFRIKRNVRSCSSVSILTTSQVMGNTHGMWWVNPCSVYFSGYGKYTWHVLGESLFLLLLKLWEIHMACDGWIPVPFTSQVMGNTHGMWWVNPCSFYFSSYGKYTWHVMGESLFLLLLKLWEIHMACDGWIPVPFTSQVMGNTHGMWWVNPCSFYFSSYGKYTWHVMGESLFLLLLKLWEIHMWWVNPCSFYFSSYGKYTWHVMGESLFLLLLKLWEIHMACDGWIPVPFTSQVMGNTHGMCWVNPCSFYSSSYGKYTWLVMGESLFLLLFKLWEIHMACDGWIPVPFTSRVMGNTHGMWWVNPCSFYPILDSEDIQNTCIDLLYNISVVRLIETLDNNLWDVVTENAPY